MTSTCFPSFPCAFPIFCLYFREKTPIFPLNITYFSGKTDKNTFIYDPRRRVHNFHMLSVWHVGLESLLLITKINKQHIKGSHFREIFTLCIATPHCFVWSVLSHDVCFVVKTPAVVCIFYMGCLDIINRGVLT